jgi:vacuolar-type H+-ATPase subunit I/STV1
MAYSIIAGEDWRDGDRMDGDVIKWGLGAAAAVLAWAVSQMQRAATVREKDLADKAAQVLRDSQERAAQALKEQGDRAAQALAHEREQNATMAAMRAEIKDSFLHVEKRLSVLGEALLDLREEFSGKLSAVQQQQQALALRVEEQQRRLDAVSELTDRKRGQLNALVLALQAQRIVTMVPGDQSMSIMAANTDQNAKRGEP